MPWSPSDASRHNRKATTPKSKRAFSKAGNSALQRGLPEGAAVKIGNSAANTSIRKSKRAKRGSKR